MPPVGTGLDAPSPPVCGHLAVVFPPPREAVDPVAQAVARAVLLNDQRIGGYAASSCTLVWNEGARSWFPMSQSVEIGDECGRWYREQRICSPSAADGKPVCKGGESSFDGREVRSQQDAESGSGGLIIQPDPGKTAFVGYSPAWFMGRMVCFNQRKSLGAMLLESKDLELVGGADGGLVRLRGTIDADNIILVCEVDADPYRGFAPVRICTFDALTGAPQELLTIEELREVDHAWFPVRGTRRAFEDDEPPPMAKQQEFRDLLVQNGLEGRVDPRSAEQRRRFQSVVRQVFGERGWGSVEARGVSPARMEVDRLERVGILCTAQLPRVEFRPDTRVLDLVRRIGSDGQPIGSPDSIGPPPAGRK
ncbi:MAG: hypothetical protein ACK4WH_11020 [Phycisphaerales bacterium]